MAWTDVNYVHSNNVFEGIPDSVYNPAIYLTPPAHQFHGQIYVEYELPEGCSAARIKLQWSGNDSGVANWYVQEATVDWNPATLTWNTGRTAITLGNVVGSGTFTAGTDPNPHYINISTLPSSGTVRYRIYATVNSGDGGGITGIIGSTPILQYEAITNTAPNTPTNSSPANAATGVSVTPTLQSSAFSDPDGADTHQASQWQITTTSGNYASPTYDSGTDTTNKTSIAVPSSTLVVSTVYYWHVRHQDNNNAWSSYSTETSFTTLTPVVVTGNSLAEIETSWMIGHTA